ncbi:hypothetical protein OG21DRAFT_1508440 [Imleria badia]|nr:hypothetical protein OG21DRAFT_1508440 [Imleria badia]
MLQPLPLSAPVSQPYYTGTWAESCKVYIWDIRRLMESLYVPGYSWENSRTK